MLKCTKFDFGWGSAQTPLGKLTYSTPPDLLAGFKGILLLRVGRTGAGNEREGKGEGDRGGRKGKAGAKWEPGKGKGGKGEWIEGTNLPHGRLKDLGSTATSSPLNVVVTVQIHSNDVKSSVCLSIGSTVSKRVF